MTKKEALEILRECRDKGFCHTTYNAKQFFLARDMAISALEHEPRTGRWLDWTDDRKDYLKCSICGYGEEGEVKFGEYTPYCPICGSRMIEP